MIGYWTNFAATGDPNGKGLPTWPVYAPDRQSVMTFDANGASVDAEFHKRYKCGFWAEQGFGVLAGPYPTPVASGPVYQ